MKITDVERELKANPQRWLVTGAAGFIGSNLVTRLLALGQFVTGIDNFSMGQRRNLEFIKERAGKNFPNFTFLEGDITELQNAEEAMRGADYVLHQAALGSVPRSLEAPLRYHEHNVTGTLNCLEAARRAQVKRFVYASSSSVYGDSPKLPKSEEDTGRALSPYAATKAIDEIYAGVYAKSYGLSVIGLRYFNVFGPMQRPDGAYAAVIPKWIGLMLKGEPIEIYGDGETSRDFCYVDNVVQMNLLAATTTNPSAVDQVYNVAVSGRTSLNGLYTAIKQALNKSVADLSIHPVTYKDFRPGDIRHSQAEIEKAKSLLGYAPTHSLQDGLDSAIDWYVSDWKNRLNK